MCSVVTPDPGLGPDPNFFFLSGAAKNVRADQIKCYF